MLFVMNKNKIISYSVAFSIVALLFLFSTFLMPDQNIELVPTSSNIESNEVNNQVNNK